MSKNRSYRKSLMVVSATAATLLIGTGASAAEKITLQLKRLPQAQFAGYYGAQSKGY